MAFKVLQFCKVGRYLKKTVIDERAMKKRRVWHGISHGFHVVESGDETDDLILAQRDQVGGLELWLFGAFDKNMGYTIRKHLQSNIFDKQLDACEIERKAADTMKKSNLITREQTMHEGEICKTGGFAAALVMNGEKFVAANFGGYKAVLSRDGMAVQIGSVNQTYNKFFRSFAGLLRMQCLTGSSRKSQKSSKINVTIQKIEPEFEFIILASDGIWEVMNTQEAVDLISYVEDAQRAAEVLAEEAMSRMSKSTISCAVIRFH